MPRSGPVSWRGIAAIATAAVAVLSLLSLGGLLLFTFVPLMLAVAVLERSAAAIERIAWWLLGALMSLEWLYLVAYVSNALIAVITLAFVIATTLAMSVASRRRWLASVIEP